MPEEPSNAMLLAGINRLYEQMADLRAEFHQALSRANELIASVAADNSRVASDLARHVMDHPT